jgi:hypothetical protein
MQSAGLRGQNAPDLAAALGQCAGQALTLFASMAMIAPGIPAAVDPISTSGSTVGPGTLLPPPAGGPDPSQIEPMALAALTSKSLNGAQKGALAKAIAQSIGVSLTMFTAQVMAAPGMAVSGFATAAPGSLMGAAPVKAQLEPIVMGFLQAEGLRGANAKDLASAIAETLAGTLSQMMSRLQVSPGIPCTPAASAGPGRLI